MEQKREYRDMRTPAQIKADDQEFKIAVQKENEAKKRAANNVKIGLALDITRSKIGLSDFRKIQSNKEMQDVCREFLILKHWLTVKFKYNHQEATKLALKDAGGNAKKNIQRSIEEGELN